IWQAGTMPAPRERLRIRITTMSTPDLGDEMNIHVKLLAGTAFLALAATHSAPAFAQSADAPRESDDGSIVVLGARNVLTTESETGSRLDISPLETPATVNTLDG